MAEKTAIVSRHVVVPGCEIVSAHSPVYAVVLIDAGVIHDVVPVATDQPVSSLLTEYASWHPVDFEHCYISPGLIDLNVQANGPWEGLALTTRSAVAGGVTFLLVEPNGYSLQEDREEVYCDVGRVEVYDDRNRGVEREVGPEVFALKTYLFPPTSSVMSGLSIIPQLLSLSSAHSIPLFIDVASPSPRMLYMASPCRFLPLEERAQTTSFTEDGFFAGAYPEDLNPHSDDSPDASNAPRLSLQMPLFAPDSDAQNSLQEQWMQYPSHSLELDDKNAESPATSDGLHHIHSTEKLSRRRRSAQLKTIVEDLRSRIEESEESIEDLSQVERMAYSGAGQTYFVLLKKRSMSFGAEPKPRSGESSGSRKAQVKTMKKPRPRPLALSFSAPKPCHDQSYIYYLANHPEHWETNGIERILPLLSAATAKVHFCNLSSARSINNVSKQKPANVTVETCPCFLFFTASGVREGETRMKSCPPVRNKLNCNLMWDLLKLGQIDVLSSHHQPVSPDFKPANFKQAIPGVSSLGFSLQSVWTRLRSPAVNQHSSDSYIVRLSKWLSVNPAKLLGVKDRGSIAKGKKADLVVWEPETVASGVYYGKHPELCPFHQVEMRGKVRRVYVRGRVAFNDGEFTAVGAYTQRN